MTLCGWKSGAEHMETIGVRKFIQPLLARSDCTHATCAWKAPRALSGFLASTTEPVTVSRSRRWQKYSHRAPTNDMFDVEHILSGGCNSGFCWRDSCREGTGSFSSFGRWRASHTRVHCTGRDFQAATENYDHITPVFLWRGLKPTISYLSLAQLGMVKDALKLAFEAHCGQKRKSGEPYIIHPVEVARILGEVEMDWETIVAGLLHDTVEDTTLVTFEMIEERYGPIVRRIVEGETKVSKLGKMQCPNSESAARDVKADDLRQMFLAMTEEVRVIIVKLADRLHNMRTLQHMPPHKQRHIAMETLQVFAPLARLLGMYRIKSELEDLSFMYAYPDDYGDLKRRVDALCQEQEEVVSEAKKVLQQTIAKDQFLSFMTSDVKIISSCKELYSIFKKMQETKCSVDEIRDIAQLRMILNMKPGTTVGPLCTAQQVCYHLLGLVHAMWPPVPQTMKDYIATPKPNGYQSLHTTVIPFGSKTFFPLEIQIRTEEMDKLAEWGVAALYSGKWVESRDISRYIRSNGTSSISVAAGSTKSVKLQMNRGASFLDEADIARRVSWLNSIREWQEEFVGNMTSREFVDTITGDLLGSRVFVFTPKGEVKNLPKGATVVDYAYQIHTDVGNRMIAAKVNGNLVSPTHTLANAEVVEIITYDGVSTKKMFQLHRQWLEFAKTRSARHKLTKFLKEQAALAVDEITAESVKAFVSDMEDNDQEIPDVEPVQQAPSFWLTTSMFSSTTTIIFGQENVKKFPIPNYYLPKGSAPKGVEDRNPVTYVNGSNNKAAEESAVTLTSGSNNMLRRSRNGVSATVNLVTVDDNAKASINLWRSGKVAMWEGSGTFYSVLWFSICCIDRKSMLAEVTAVLGAAGILICACAAETDRLRGIGIMLFHVEANDDNLVVACSSIDNIEGVVDWSVGCSWQNPRRFISTT